ncbi:unnamed protein product [Alternaria alternata]
MSSPTENRKHKQFLDAALDSAITLAAREREVKRLDENKERLLSQIEEMSIPVGGRESLDEVQTYDRNVRTAKAIFDKAWEMSKRDADKRFKAITQRTGALIRNASAVSESLLMEGLHDDGEGWGALSTQMKVPSLSDAIAASKKGNVKTGRSETSKVTGILNGSSVSSGAYSSALGPRSPRDAHPRPVSQYDDRMKPSSSHNSVDDVRPRPDFPRDTNVRPRRPSYPDPRSSDQHLSRSYTEKPSNSFDRSRQESPSRSQKRYSLPNPSSPQPGL